MSACAPASASRCTRATTSPSPRCCSAPTRRYAARSASSWARPSPAARPRRRARTARPCARRRFWPFLPHPSRARRAVPALSASCRRGSRRKPLVARGARSGAGDRRQVELRLDVDALDQRKATADVLLDRIDRRASAGNATTIAGLLRQRAPRRPGSARRRTGQQREHVDRDGGRHGPVQQFVRSVQAIVRASRDPVLVV